MSERFYVLWGRKNLLAACYEGLTIILHCIQSCDFRGVVFPEVSDISSES